MGNCQHCGQGAIACDASGPLCPDCFDEGYSSNEERQDAYEDMHVDKFEAWDAISVKNKEIARLTLALSTARNDALDEAVNACEKQRLAAMNEDCKRESLGASWCREAIAVLKETT